MKKFNFKWTKKTPAKFFKFLTRTDKPRDTGGIVDRPRNYIDPLDAGIIINRKAYKKLTRKWAKKYKFPKHTAGYAAEYILRPGQLVTADAYNNPGAISYYLNNMRDSIHRNAKRHGFWPKGRSDAEALILIHAEISEVIEALRDPLLPEYPYAPATYHRPGQAPKPAGIPDEMADIIIRVLDFCGARRIDIGRAVALKIKYNATRPYRHGKKF